MTGSSTQALPSASGSCYSLGRLCFHHPARLEMVQEGPTTWGLALQPCPGALWSAESNQGGSKTLLMACNATWKVLFLRRKWFLIISARHVTPLYWERVRMAALAASGEAKRTERVPRAWSITGCPRQGAGATHIHSFLGKHCLVWEGVHHICSSSCRANGVIVPDDVAQQHTALFTGFFVWPDTILINGYQTKLQKLPWGKKKKSICMEVYRWEWWSWQ